MPAAGWRQLAALPYSMSVVLAKIKQETYIQKTNQSWAAQVALASYTMRHGGAVLALSRPGLGVFVSLADLWDIASHNSV
jgi:hypothetical protein